MTGILMGTETVDQHGVPYVLVIPDVSVFDPGMSDSLVGMPPAARAWHTTMSAFLQREGWLSAL